MQANGKLLNQADQIANLLRQKIHQRSWSRRLPPQRVLALELGTSRRSLAEALRTLQKEGLLINRHQGGTYLAPRRRKKPTTPLSVGIVYSSHHKGLVGRQIQLLNIIQKFFQSRQVRIEVHQVPYLEGHRVSGRFKSLIRETIHQCWILVSPTAPMQIWCTKQHVPAFVYGIAHPSSHLSSIGVDHFAVARHAAGEMLRRGHRHLAVILPDEEKGEDIQCRLGFADGVRNSLHPDAIVNFEHHDRNLDGVCRLADRLLAACPRPTAWLICRQGHFLSIYCHLLRRKIEIPQELSLVSRDSDFYFGDIVPEPTRYVVNFDLMARRSARKVLEIIHTSSPLKQSHLMIPDFVVGQTLGGIPTKAMQRGSVNKS